MARKKKMVRVNKKNALKTKVLRLKAEATNNPDGVAAKRLTVVKQAVAAKISGKKKKKKGKLKAFSKKVNTARKAVNKKIGKGIKKGAKFVKKMAVKGVQAAAFAPLIPLKGVMKSALKKKGLKTENMSLPEIAKQFYNKIVAGKMNLEPIPEHFEANNIVVLPLIAAIVGFIKNLKTKKASGQPLTSIESTVLKGGEKVEKKLRVEEIRDAAKTGVEASSDIQIKGVTDTTDVTGEKASAKKKDRTVMYIIIAGLLFFAFRK